MSDSRKLIYLAGPIDHVTREGAMGWRDEASEALTSWGYSTFSPVHAFRIPDQQGPGQRVAEAILQVNAEVIGLCDIVLANLNDPSSGTGAELQFARTIGKPIVSFGGAPTSLFVLAHRPCPNLDAAIEQIVAQSAGRA